ncbi:MAG: hypothetical protein NTX97_03525 [Bacteroidetes bacterium]|nr:hypothetical protein [Bacteroidota bacterium]
MKIIHKHTGNSSGESVLRTCLFLFLVLLFSTKISIANTSDSASIAGTDSSALNGGQADIKNTAKVFEEARKIEEENTRIRNEKIRRDDIIEKVIMVVGFSIVIAIAWFTTVLARNRKKKEDDARAIHHQNLKNRGHHHHDPHYHPKK